MASLPVLGQSPLAVTLQANNYNGYNVKCFGKQNGSIAATITGGTAPYQTTWSNGATTEDLGNLSAGYYKLTVLDADSTVVITDITLTEPTPLIVVAEPYIYSNGFNVSCYDCYNGSIDVSVGQGVPPYNYLWNDSTTTTQDRSGLDAKKFFVVVTDANNCWVKSESMILDQPKRSVWDMGGNANSDPANQFLGTTDNTDVVFKSNGQERLRLKNNGDIKLGGPTLTSGPLYLNGDGILRAGALDELPIVESTPCGDGLGGSPYWKVGGNGFVYPQCESNVVPLLGTTVPLALRLITNGAPRLSISKEGKVGIGTTQPNAKLHVEGDLLVRTGPSDIVTSYRPDKGETGTVLWARNAQAAWGLSIDSYGKGHILGDWNDPHPDMTFAYDKVGIGNVTMGESDLYKLYVEGGIIGRDLKVTAMNFPDYVFAPSYSLMSLDELENFIASEKHLPGIPSAHEIKEAGGFEVGDMSTRLLKLAEEQSLYILQLNKEVEALKVRITDLEAVRAR
ncbi:MAG: SprB repeat-containing protein [Flavobacteriales bacterium]|nr:SprB repeat-containing protein [Flavobacteriales bacterium]